MSVRMTQPASAISATPRPRDSRMTLRDPLALPDGPPGDGLVAFGEEQLSTSSHPPGRIRHHPAHVRSPGVNA